MIYNKRQKAFIFTSDIAKGIQVTKPEVTVVVKLSPRVRIGMMFFKLSVLILHLGCWIGGFTFVAEDEDERS